MRLLVGMRFGFLVVFMVLAASSASARNTGNLMRGGVGFLFPDHNSFVNPGQLAADPGVAVEALYSRNNQSGGNQTLTPSFVYGDGTFGFGAYGQRVGPTLTSGADTVGGAVGVALLKKRVTVGLGVNSPVTPGGGPALFEASVTVNPANGSGSSFGLGYNFSTRRARIGFGYSASFNKSIEFNATFPNINDLGTLDFGAYGNWARGSFFVGGGYTLRETTTTTHGVTARTGLVLGQSFDVSLHFTYFFYAGSPVDYGITLRSAF
jgi:hypothetical protein